MLDKCFIAAQSMIGTVTELAVNAIQDFMLTA